METTNDVLNTITKRCTLCMVPLPAQAVNACIAWTTGLQGSGQHTVLVKPILHPQKRTRPPLQMRTMDRRKCEKAPLIFTHDQSDISM